MNICLPVNSGGGFIEARRGILLDFHVVLIDEHVNGGSKAVVVSLVDKGKI